MLIPPSTRLSYRMLTENDADLLFELDQDEAVMRYLNGGVRTSMDDIVNRFIPRLQSFRNEEKGWGLWQVNTREDNEYIGWILVRPMYFFNENRNDKDLELGWRFKQKAWGKGYASEAAAHIADAIAEANKPDAFSAIAAEDNLGSIAIMKKLGMSFVKKDLHIDPVWQAEVVYYTKPLR
jgi:RimJ/RimL family protein N-acetyltransferase